MWISGTFGVDNSALWVGEPRRQVSGFERLVIEPTGSWERILSLFN